MDRPTTRPEADARGFRLDADQALVLESRRPALDLCRSAAGAHGPAPGRGTPAGPVLLTGDAGAGKTWLWRRLEAEAPTGRRWISVDLTPSDDPADFYRLVAHELGLIGPIASPPAASRVGLVDFLAGRQADGERIGLVVEEAHNLSGDLWEEVRVLANRLDRPGGFASMMLVGQTPLALRFSTRPFAAIEARLASRVHLGPIGVDEAKELLTRSRPGHVWADDEVEILHRDASGNPRRLLRLAVPRVDANDRPGDDRRSVGALPASLDHRPGVDPTPAKAAWARLVSEAPAATDAPPAGPIASPAPLTGPARPPILVEDNMIEVGWSADESSQGEPAEGPGPRAGRPASSEAVEQAVEDHYAALQAWREWSANQASRARRPSDNDDEPEIDLEDDETAPATSPPPRPDRPTVRAEGEQKFAPFGQLFSRMAQAREPE